MNRGLNDMKNVCFSRACNKGQPCPRCSQSDTVTGNRYVDGVLTVAMILGIAWLLVQGV